MDAIRIRASSWSELFDCAHRWEGKYLLGMTRPSTGAAHLGTSIHHATASFDESARVHAGLTVDEAAGVFVTELANPTEEVNRVESDLPPRVAERIGVSLVSRYCAEISPKYVFKGIEITTKPLDITVGDITIQLSGTMDRSRIRAEGEGISIADIKSGKRAVTKGKATVKAHHIQVGIYELLAEHSLGETISGPAEIIGLQTTNSAAMGVSQVPDARAGLLGTANEPGLIEMAAGMLKSGIFPPNPSSMLCHPNYCPRWAVCLYHSR